MEENEKMKTENNSDNNANQQNSYSEIKPKNKKLTIVLVALIILLILAIGVCAGSWLASDTTKIINKTEENQEQVKEDENITNKEEEIKTGNTVFDNITNKNFKEIEISFLQSDYSYHTLNSKDYSLVEKIINIAKTIELEEKEYKSFPEMNFIVIQYDNEHVVLRYDNLSNRIIISTGSGDTFKVWENADTEKVDEIKEIVNEYKKDNPDKVEKENTTNNQNETNVSSINKIFNTTLKDIEKVSIAILDENNTSAKVDINKDGVEETIKIEKVKGNYDETWKLYINDKVFFDHNTNEVKGIFRYFFKLYVVDLDSSDNYYDIVVRGVDGSERRYCIFKYNGTTFNPILESSNENAIIFNGDSLYIDNLGTVVPQEYCFVHTNPVLSNRYYSYRENKVYNVPVGNYTNDLIEFKNVYFTTDLNNIGVYMESASKGEGNEEELLKKSGISYHTNIKVYIVEYDNDPYMIKVKLEDGTLGYIFTSEGVFAG